MRRRTYRFPNETFDRLEAEAKRRLIEMNKVGTRLLGSVCRDILCILLEQHLGEIQSMSIEEFMEACKDVKNNG